MKKDFEMMALTCFALVIACAVGFFYGHEFGYVDGQQYQKLVNNDQLQNCHRIVAGEIFSNPGEQ
jgi:hypothetical protein